MVCKRIGNVLDMWCISLEDCAGCMVSRPKGKVLDIWCIT